MESQIERISPVECRVRVIVPWNEVSGRLDEKMRELRGRVRLPGFRPGKVPPQVLERMFGKSVRDELTRDLVEETFRDAVGTHKAVALTQPVVESSALVRGEPFSYAARFEVPPEVAPKDYVGVPVRRRPAMVDPAKVDEELERKRQDQAELHPVPEDRKTTVDGDVWIVDVEGALGEQRVSRKDVKIEIGRTEGEYVPGIGAALAGTAVGEVGTSKALTFVPPQDRIRSDLRGTEARLVVGLREVKERRVPALDDEFARDTGEAETLEELRGKIRARLLQEDADVAERDARTRLVETLLERNPFDASPSLIAREVAAQVDLTKRQLAQQGLTLKQVGASENDLARQARPQALFSVKAYLLLDAIGKAESVDATDEEVSTELEQMAKERGQVVARLRATMEKNNELLVLRAQIREEKILDFLMGKAVVTEAPDPEPQGASVESAVEAAKQSVDGGKPTGTRRKQRRKSKVGDAADAESDHEGEASAGDEPTSG